MTRQKKTIEFLDSKLTNPDSLPFILIYNLKLSTTGCFNFSRRGAEWKPAQLNEQAMDFWTVADFGHPSVESECVKHPECCPALSVSLADAKDEGLDL